MYIQEVQMDRGYVLLVKETLFLQYYYQQSEEKDLLFHTWRGGLAAKMPHKSILTAGTRNRNKGWQQQPWQKRTQKEEKNCLN